MPFLTWFALAALAVVLAAAQAPAAPGAPGNRTLTQADIDTIVAMHNSLRSKISPIATNMFRVTWDPELAVSAQAYANTCPTAHSGKPNLGENLSWGWPTMTPSDAVQEWIKEGPHYSFVTNACASGKVCAHYTQMIWSNSAKVGCAVRSCPNILGQPITDAWVCHYTHAGNVVGAMPYAAGPAPCSACPNTTDCVENLCTIPGTPTNPSSPAGPMQQAGGGPAAPGAAQGPVQPGGGFLPLAGRHGGAASSPVMMALQPAAPAYVPAVPGNAPAAPGVLATAVTAPVSAVPVTASRPVLRPAVEAATSTPYPVVGAEDRVLSGSPLSPFIIVQTTNRTAPGSNSTDNSTISTTGASNSSRSNNTSNPGGTGSTTTTTATTLTGGRATTGAGGITTTVVGFGPRTFFGGQ